MKSIIFNTEMVRAILDGRKTVMREYIKKSDGFEFCDPDGGVLFEHSISTGSIMAGCLRMIQPKYGVGDILYVKETFMEHHTFVIETTLPNPNILYKADYNELDADMMACGIDQWKPPIHMPKEAARLFLRVTGVRIERLHDIKGYETFWEGIDSGICKSQCHNDYHCYINIANNCCSAINAYKNLWNSNIKQSELDQYGWDANPLVRVYEFEVISKEEAMKEENNASNCMRKQKL